MLFTLDAVMCVTLAQELWFDYEIPSAGRVISLIAKRRGAENANAVSP